MSPILLRFLPYIAGLAVLVGGILFYGHSRYNAGQEAVRVEMAAALARVAVETAEARQKAVEATKAEAAVREGEAEKARQKAANEAAAWKRRYNEAKRSPECSKWSLEPVLCPLPVVPTAPQTP